MDPNVLRSYLVSLGFQVNQPQLNQFNTALKQAASLVEGHTGLIAGHMLKWQAAITGAFAAVSTAVLGLADHVAMADQEYRLFALHMFTSQDTARKLTIATDALGVSLEEMIWDPELRARAVEQFELIDRLQQQLGPDFEDRMRRIRDFRGELGKLGTEMKFLSMQFVSALFEKFGTTIDDVYARLQQFGAWLAEHIPDIADTVASELVPVLKDTWLIVKSLGEMFGIAAQAFVNLVAEFSGDDSIRGTELSFHSLAGALEHVVHWAAEFAQAMTLVEKIVLHLVSAISYALFGHFSKAFGELKAGLGDLTGEAGAILGAIGGSTGLGVAGGTLGTMAGAALGTMLFPGAGTAAGAALGTLLGGIGTAAGVGGGAILGGAAGYGAGRAREALLPGLSNPSDLEPMRATEAMPLREMGNAVREYRDAIIREAQAANIDPRVALSVGLQESGIRQFDRAGRVIASNAGALGVMQLEPGTARDLGVDPNDPYQNIHGGVQYLAQLYRRYQGNWQAALEAYNAGPGNVDAALRYHRSLRGDVAGYASSVLGRAQQIDVGGITVQISQPGATPEQIQQATLEGAVRGVRRALQQQTQLDLAQLAPAQ
ncbi:MAG TPA: lytic transglycosylase domain-containing protein [Bryobacteraceae bacterium]|jgi:hypothetical protein|nr:lytic transglycosylase domain-containing protein [Bryobacteraceae bacterium]